MGCSAVHLHVRHTRSLILFCHDRKALKKQTWNLDKGLLEGLKGAFFFFFFKWEENNSSVENCCVLYILSQMSKTFRHFLELNKITKRHK